MVKVADLAWGRLQSPDLDKQEEFLVNFGMTRVERTKNKLFMRGTGPAHHIHITELGPPKFLGAGFVAKSEDDLKALAKLPGASAVENLDEPGGGKRVRLTEPNGYTIEVVHGISTLPPLPVKRQDINWRDSLYERVGEVMRIHKGPSRVMRIGHVVLATTKLPETLKWFRDTLGLISSDDLYAGPDKKNVIASFNRLDRGDDYVDHHVFFAMSAQKSGLNHLSFEVDDIDDVFTGHEHMKKIGKYEHMWGIGRHLLGSQVYDYWADPWMRVHEHWSDSDRLNTRNGSNLLSIEEGFQSQWGEPPPEKFIQNVSQ
jgi:catechol 2,3-dioxygenase-like lactoylglutathione lyase family enzyme